jgi:hypothetical protein
MRSNDLLRIHLQPLLADFLLDDGKLPEPTIVDQN